MADDYFEDQVLMIISNRPVRRDDYNIFLQGIMSKYGSYRGILSEHVSKALREYGLKMISNTATKDTKTIIFGEDD